MEDSQFTHLANRTLDNLSVYIEELDEDTMLDVEYQDGVLTITLEDNRQFVVNRHIASQKIWYSSPFSGAAYYSYDEDNAQWHNDDGAELQHTLTKELIDHVPLNVSTL